MAQTDHATSTGHHLSGADYIDLHFEVNRPEYTEIVETVGFEPGWHVLDAGCGSGSFLPLIAERIGPQGKITAIDLASENVELTRERLAQWNLPCPVTVHEATIFDLPFPDDSFNAVWCANVTAYLTDEELDRALVEFVRVTRPGGIVAIKDVQNALISVEPAPASIINITVAEFERQGDVQAHGAIRGWNLHRYLERAGLTGIEQQAILAERRAPLDQPTRDLYTAYLAFMAEHASSLPLTDEHREFWQKQIDPDNPEAAVNHPDFYFTEGQTLAIGRVPGKAS